jgi:BASS family bile acid:Na+ symporter
MDIQEINNIRINFDEDMVAIMNFALAFVMFGVALNLRWEDFKELWAEPSKVLIGLSSQLLLLPLFTILLIALAGLPYSMALGMILVASCPGGNISNYATHLARGNTALSITLTTIVTLAATLITPFSFVLWAQAIPQSIQGQDLGIEVNVLEMLWIVMQLILIPIVSGMSLRYFLPSFAERIKKSISILSLLIFLAFIIGAIYGNWELIVQYVYLVFWLVVLHNGIALFLAYAYARIWKLPQKDARAISLETGVQNAGLGLVLVLNFFEGLGGMLLVVAWWGIWDLVSSLIIALIWRYRSLPMTQNHTLEQS